MNRNKSYCISELKQRLVDVRQSATKGYWCDHQQLKKVTESVHAYVQMDNVLNSYCEFLILFSKRCSFATEFVIFRVLKYPNMYIKQVRREDKPPFNGTFTQ